jgi:hypothetical protein
LKAGISFRFSRRDGGATDVEIIRDFAELVGVVEVMEVAAGEPSVGVDQWLDDLGVDLVADVALAL